MLAYSLNLTIPASEVLWTSSLLFVLSVDFHLHQLIFLCIFITAGCELMFPWAFLSVGILGGLG